MSLRRLFLCLPLAFSSFLSSCAVAPSGSPTAAASNSNSSTYPAALAEAKRLASENSWALARDAYARAQTLAPDADARRWADLWHFDATWRAEDLSRDWSQREAQIDRTLSGFDAFLKNAPDTLWLATMESRLAFLTRARKIPEAQTDRLAIADRLGAQLPSSATAEAYLRFLKTNSTALDSNPLSFEETDRRLLSHLDHAFRLASQPEDRALFAFRLASFTDSKSAIPVDERARRWTTAAEFSRGTTFETLARARQFLFLSRTGFSPNASPDSPADLPARLNELRAFRAALGERVANEEIKKTSEDLRRLEEWWSVPQLLVGAPTLIQPGSPFRLTYGTAGHARIVVTLYRHSLENWSSRAADQRELQRAGILSNAQLTAETLTRLRRPGTDETRRLTFTFDDAARLTWHQGDWEIAPSLEPGFYTALIQSESSAQTDTRTLDLIVSSVQAVATISTGKPGTLHVFQTADRQPVAGATLRAVVTENESAPMALATQLDSSGNASLPPFNAAIRNGVTAARLSAFVGTQPIDLLLNSWQAQNSPLTAEFIVDRPLYRPGETVYWKLIARERADHRFVKPTQSLRMSIALERDEKLVDNTVVELNAFGTAHGSFVIPVTARPGEATLDLNSSDDATNRPGVFQGIFRVDNFVPPAITAQLELASAPTSLRPGREITVRLRSQYFSGGPVVGAPVQLQFQSEPFYHPFLRGEEKNPELTAWIESIGKESQSATTGIDGTAEFRLLLPTFLPERLILRLEASLQPEGGQAVSTSARWQINHTGAQVALEGNPSPVPIRPGETHTFAARITDGRGEPFAFKGSAQLVEKTWSEAWLTPDGRIVSGEEKNAAFSASDENERPLLAATWKRLHAGYATQVIATKPITADVDGKINVDFVPPHAGLFDFQLDDETGVLPAAEFGFNRDFVLVAANDDTRSLPMPSSSTQLFASSSFLAGQPLRFLAAAPAGTQTGWLTLSGENEFVARRVDLRGGVAWITIDSPPKFAGGGVAELSLLDSPARTFPVRVNFSTLDDSSQLAVTIRPASLENKPGAESNVALSVTAPDQKPVSSEIVFLASDDALHALTGPSNDTPEFWNFQSILSATTSTTRSPQQTNSFNDPRPGVRLNPSVPPDDDALILSPFEVASSNHGYMAASSLAGSRLRSLPDPSATVLGPNAKLDTASITIRRHFSFTAAWQPEILTGANGSAQTKFRYPDNLTRWRLDAYAVGADGHTFGRAHTFTTTSLPFQARLQLPRFLVAGDTAAPSALFLNRTDRDARASATLRTEGAAEFIAAEKSGRENLAVPPQAEARTAWSIKATRTGDAQFTLAAQAGDNSDGMAVSVPVLEDGLQQETAASGRLASSETSRTLKLTLPSPLDPARTHVQLQLSPSSAAAFLDALPYLIDYPYGCVEQTMNRFMPAVVVRKTLRDLGYDAAAVERRILARSFPPPTQPGAGLGALDEVVQQSLARLAQAQQPGGTFGWWPGQLHADLWMTGYVAWGLALAHDAGVDVPPTLAGETVRGLVQLLTQSSELTDPYAWALAALARIQGDTPDPSALAAFARLYAARERLGPSGRACLLLAARTLGQPEERRVLLRNLENGARRIKAADLGDTVSWGSTDNSWRAMDNPAETTALVLLALLEIDPSHPLIEPAMNWLTLNRRSAHWSSTRDTAFAILALSRFITARHESAPDAEIEILANGRSVQRLKLTTDSLLAGPINLTIDPALLRAGENVLTLRRVAGKSTVYAVALASSWARGDSVRSASHLITTSRDFVRQHGELTLMGTLRLTSQPLGPNGAAQAGEQVHARVTLNVPNELEYLMVEVPKPAGCEPLNPLSGWDARLVSPDEKKAESAKKINDPIQPDQGRVLYREEHDDRSVFFLDRVPAGTWEINFGLRATTPGDFRALPVKATAMYVPEVRANSDARRLRIDPAR